MPHGYEISERTTIPINWLFAMASCAGGVLVVAAGLMIWGTRLEAKGEFQETRLTRVEINQDQYAKDQNEVRSALVRLEVLMKERGRQ